MPTATVQVYGIDLDVGDVIILATDGLWDNVWDDDIAALVLASLQVSAAARPILSLIQHVLTVPTVLFRAKCIQLCSRAGPCSL